MKLNIPMGEFAYGFEGDILSSSGLGSCIGLVLYDIKGATAIMGHIMLPDSSENKLIPKSNKSILPAILNNSLYEQVKKLLNPNQYNLLINIPTENNLFESYSKEKPGIVLFDFDFVSNVTSVIEKLIRFSDTASIIILLDAFKKDKLVSFKSNGVKEVLHTPLFAENVNFIFNVTVNDYLLKYADIMVDYLIKRIKMLGVNQENIAAKIAGGAHMFSDKDYKESIGCRNLLKVKELLTANNIPLISEETGDNIGRSVSFDVSTRKMLIKTYKGNKEI